MRNSSCRCADRVSFTPPASSSSSSRGRSPSAHDRPSESQQSRTTRGSRLRAQRPIRIGQPLQHHPARDGNGAERPNRFGARAGAFAKTRTDRSPPFGISQRADRRRKHEVIGARQDRRGLGYRICSSFKFLTFTFFHSRSAVRAGTPSCTARARQDRSPSPRPY